MPDATLRRRSLRRPRPHAAVSRRTGSPPRVVAGIASGVRPPALLLVVLALLLPGFDRPARAHPQDGPHADIRMALGDTELRADIGMNLGFMDAMVGARREFLDELAPVEEAALESAMRRYLAEENRVEVNGREIEPVIERFEILRPDRTLLPLFPRMGMRGLLRARARVVYPLEEPAERLAVHWARFPRDIIARELEGKDVSMALEIQLAAEGVIEIVRVSEADPTYEWTASHLTMDDRLETVPTPTETLAASRRALAAADDDAAAPAPRNTSSAPDDAGRAGAPSPTTASGAPRTIRIIDDRPLLVLPIAFAALGAVALLAVPFARRGRRGVGVAASAVLFVVAVGIYAAVEGRSVPGASSRATAVASANGDARTVDESPARPAPARTVREGVVTEDAALAAFRPLHVNLYRAFDFTAERDVYDALARSVEGELLADLYDRIYRGLVMADHENAVGRITDVELLEARTVELDDRGSLEGRPGFAVEARWQVEGTVHHWGHAHRRLHEYAALYVIADRGDAWRIVAHVPIEQRRLPVEGEEDPSLPPSLLPPGIEF